MWKMEVALFCFCFISTWQITFQNLLTRNGRGPPQLKDYEHAENNDRLYHHYQAIVPTYNLSCCGNIIVWGLDVYEDQIRYILDLQVWRPSPTVDDSTGTGCYSLVGNNRFNISLSEEVAKVTPSPQDYIQFQDGDALGFYVEEAIAKNTNNKPPGVVLRTSPSYLTSEIVWFASLNHEAATSQNGDCPYSVGSNGGVLNTLTQAAPVISISIASVPCSPLPVVGLITQSTASLEFHTSSINTELFPSPSITYTSCIKGITDSTWINTIVSSGVPNLCKPITTETNTRTIPKKNVFNIGLVTGTVVALLVATVFFIVISLAIIIQVKFGRVTRQTHENATAVNPAYGVTITLQDTHTPGENAYDYPTINTQINNETRTHEACRVVYETIAAAREGTCSHSVVELQAGTDGNIEAKQNEAYAVIADVVMKKNEAYNIMNLPY